LFGQMTRRKHNALNTGARDLVEQVREKWSASNGSQHFWAIGHHRSQARSHSPS
jgi:hypothetical protein